MKARTLLFAALVLGNMVTAGLAWRFYADLVVLRSETQAQLRASASAGVSSSDVTPRMQPPQTADESVTVSRDTRHDAALAPGMSSGGGDHSSTTGLAAFLETMSNPQFQNLSAVQAEVRLDSQYAALFKELNLPPDQLQQFKKLLVEKQMVAFDAMAAAKQQGIDPATDPQGFFQSIGEAQKNVDQQIAGAIGEDGYAKFQAYVQSLPARNTTDLVQQSLSYTAAPLTADQSRQLTQILTTNAPPLARDANAFGPINAGMGVTALTEQAVAQAQGILQPNQLQALISVVRQQQQLLQAQRQMGRRGGRG
jgi:hypothetical protein